MSPEPLNEETSSSTALPKSYGEIFNLVAKYGIASVIAIYLVYFLTSTIASQTQLAVDSHSRIETALQNQQRESAIYLQELSLNRKALVRICINTAKTDADRARCVE